jgi:hypothetical protein
MGMSNIPSDLWVMSKVWTTASGTNQQLYSTQTATAATAVTAAATPGAIGTGYAADFDFTLQTGSTAVALTLYGETSNASDALVIEPGSSCGWLP